MSTTLKTAGEQTMLYRYDQLNRIKTAVSTQNTYQTGYSYDANGNILSLLRNDHNNATIDNLSYSYNTNVNNRLNSVNDVSGNNEGLEANGVHSYTYDDIGNLTSDKDISSVKWTVYGKVASVTKNDTEISYKYDATGNRIYKKVVSSSVSKETHYVRDASGNLMATYENKIAKEFVIYGSSRLGIYNGSTSEGKRTLGNKKYELSNHLGNVLSVISDNKIGIGTNGVADYYEPYIVSESDYYPFGMTMEKRSFASSEYRFGMNGQEKSDELDENGNSYTAEFWQYSSVIARRWNSDPVFKHYESFYASFGNNPIWFVDSNGADTAIVNLAGKVIDHRKGGENILFHNNGKDDNDFTQLRQIYLNDPSLDGSAIEDAKIGGQLVRFLSRENTNWIIDKAGGNDFFKSELRHVQLAVGSQVHFDYAINMLIPNIAKDAKGVSESDDYDVWDQAGVLIVFTGVENTAFAYNVPDAGNFLFGATAHRMGVSYIEVLLGSQLNEGFKDSEADQRAIARGYRYSNTIDLYHRYKYSYFGIDYSMFVDYDLEKPTWFKEKFDDDRYRRGRGKENARDDDYE